MTYLNIGDRRWWGMEPFNIFFTISRILVFVGAPSIFVSEVLYLLIHYHELSFASFSNIATLILLSLITAVMVIVAQTKKYKMLMKVFMDHIHLYNYRDGTETVNKLVLKIEKLTRWTASFLLFFTMATALSWSIFTTKFSIKYKDLAANRTVQLQTIFYLLSPFEYEYNFNYWILTHGFVIYVTFVGSSMIAIFNTIIFMFIYNFIGHIEMFKIKGKTLFFEGGSDQEIQNKLTSVIEYHLFIVKIFKQIQEAFGIHVAVAYFYNLIADSFVLYQLMVGEKENIITYGPIIMAHGGSLILISFVFEEIVRRTVDIPDLIYELPWEKMSIPNQKTVLMLLVIVQQPMFFKATWGLTAGVKPMVSILKSTFSYYVMLKSSI